MLFVSEEGKNGGVLDRNFSVGSTYNFVLENRCTEQGQFTLPLHVSAYGGVALVCDDQGKLSEPVTSIGIDNEDSWMHGIMGDLEQERCVVEEGNYLIQVHTRDGFDSLLSGYEKDDPCVVISRIERLWIADMVGSLNMRVATVSRFKASDLPKDIGILKPAVIEALEHINYDFIAQTC